MFKKVELLKYDRIKNVVRNQENFNLFTVCFKDCKGNSYTYAPKWDDLQSIFFSACMTEFYNNEDKPNKVDLGGFEHIAKRIIARAY